MSNHASQVMTSVARAHEEILNQRKLKFTLHPEKPLMVTIGYDNDLVFWNIETHTSVYSDTLSNTPSCIKFSPDGKYLATGFENGTVQICTIGEEKDKKSKKTNELPLSKLRKTQIANGKSLKTLEKDGLAAIIYKVEQSIVEQQCYVLNIVFSRHGQLMAISYLNNSGKMGEEGEERVTGVVHIYKLNESESGKRNARERLYTKFQMVKSTVCSNVVQGMNLGSYFMTFGPNDRYLFLNFQQFDKFNLRENDDKERNYIVWDLLNNQKQDNFDMINDSEVGPLLFPNHINGLYKYHERYLEKTRPHER